MLSINIADRREQRKFGLMMGAAAALLGLIRYVLGGFAHVPVCFFALAATLAVLGLLLPGSLKPLFAVWLKLAEVLNWLMTRVFLTAAFYLMITPVRVIIRTFGEDPLKRTWRREAATYWEDPEEQPKEMDRYLNQF